MDLLQDIYHEALRWYNLPFTILFGLVLIYWAFQTIGALFGAVIDFDFDFDGDGHVEGAEESLFGRFAYALSDGEAPFMWALSFFITLIWASMMALNHFFNPLSVWSIGIAIIAGSLALALYLTRKFMIFSARIIRRIIGMTPQKESFIGEIGVVVTGEVTEKYGQIEIDHAGVPCRFSVELMPGADPLQKGDFARIVRKGETGKTYLVEKTAEQPRLESVEAAK